MIGNERWGAVLALVLGACLLGSGSILVRFSGVGPAAAGFWRLALSLPLIVVLARRAHESMALRSPLAILAGLLFGFDLAFWHYGIVNTSIANANLLANMAPVVVAALSWIFLRERLRPQFLVALMLAIGGAWLVTGRSDSGSRQASALGDLLSVATAVWYALYMLAVGVSRRTDGALRVMLWSTLAGAPLLLIIAFLLREPILPASVIGWAACIGLALMHVVGQGAITWALGRLPASTASVVVLIQPVAAASLAWMLFAEVLSDLQFVGAALVIAGVVLAQGVIRPAPARALT